MHSWFANPWALALLALVPTAFLFAWRADRKRQEVLAKIGSLPAILRLRHILPQRRSWQRLTLTLGMLCLILGMAGPIIGIAPRPNLLGQDLVIVLDMSRSMHAEQPSRLEKALRPLRALAERLEVTGQARVGVVIFASHAKVLFPLTHDVGHLSFALAQIREHDQPASIRAREGETTSGTRIGAALDTALALFASPRPGRQHILLLSDGDDPANDGEWLEGVQHAHERGVPIHVVPIGTPGEKAAIPDGGNVFKFQNEIVYTQVQEARLKEIADRSAGLFVAPGSVVDALETRWRNVRATDVDPETVADVAPRYGILLSLAFVLLVVSMIISEGPRARRPVSVRPAVALVLLAFGAVAAADVDDWLRRGDTAFAQENWATALECYTRAAVDADDPGLVAFNLAATYYRLGQYHEAELHYRRALDDRDAPPARRARAFHDLGNALVQKAARSNRVQLEQAMAAYRSCLDAAADDALRQSAVHNLQLAGLQWRKAKPPQNPMEDDPVERTEPDTKPTDPKQDDPKPGDKTKDGTGLKPGTKTHEPGSLEVLRDDENVQSLSREQALAHLERVRERIVQELRAQQNASPPALGTIKDW